MLTFCLNILLFMLAISIVLHLKLTWDAVKTPKENRDTLDKIWVIICIPMFLGLSYCLVTLAKILEFFEAFKSVFQ